MEQWEQWILYNGQSTMMKAVTARSVKAMQPEESAAGRLPYLVTNTPVDWHWWQ